MYYMCLFVVYFFSVRSFSTYNSIRNELLYGDDLLDPSLSTGQLPSLQLTPTTTPSTTTPAPPPPPPLTVGGIYDVLDALARGRHREAHAAAAGRRERRDRWRHRGRRGQPPLRT